MAEIVILKPGEFAPSSGDRVLIVRDAAKKTCQMTVWHADAVIEYPDHWSFDQAMMNAKRDADTFGIPVIYMQEINASPASGRAIPKPPPGTTPSTAD